MVEVTGGSSAAGLAPADQSRNRVVSFTMLAVISIVLGLTVGWRTVMVQGLLSQSDAYQRVSRIVASFEAGRVLDHIPRDNAGSYIALHWSHLLDAVIVLLALPLMPFMETARALHYGGAALGPFTLFLAAIGTALAVERLCGEISHAAIVGAVAIMGPPVIAYGAFGQADHHVVLGALAVVTPAFAYADARAVHAWRSAAIGGILGAIGVWISPEMIPFVLFGWAVAILCDVAATRAAGARAIAFAAGLGLMLAVAFAIDPPAPDRFAAEPDRLSLPFVELGFLMLVVSFLAHRFSPRLQGMWPPAILAGAIAAVGLAPWAVLHPEILRGPSGIFSESSQARIWNFITEMGALNTLELAIGLGVFPTAALVVGFALLLRRDRSPLSVLAAAMAAIVVYFAWIHLRFAVYLHLAATVVIGVFLARTLQGLRIRRTRRIAVILAMLFAIAPSVGMMLVPHDEKLEPRGACSIPTAAASLASQAGRVVLTELNYSPPLIYFTRAVAVAGPYHRSEKLIIAVLDAWRETSFQSGMPASFKATHASSILVCRNDHYGEGTLGAVLARGETPDWLREVPLPPELNFRLLEVR